MTKTISSEALVDPKNVQRLSREREYNSSELEVPATLTSEKEKGKDIV